MPTYVYWIRFLYQVLSDGWLSMERPESVSTQSGCFKRGAKTIINDLQIGQTTCDLSQPLNLQSRGWPWQIYTVTVTQILSNF